EPRLLRDAHLGSIWEGTSNIVALDVLRAIERNGCLPVLRDHVRRLLAEGRACPPELAPLQEETLDKAFSLAEHAAHGRHAELARQAASALYNALTLAALRWEAAHEGLETRGAIADLVLRHRLASRDPCAPDAAGPGLDALRTLVF